MDDRAKKELQEYLKDRYISSDFVDEVKKQRIYDFIYKNFSSTFKDTLEGFIAEKGVTALYIYKKADLNRNIYSCIKKDRFHNVSKKTVLRFVLALELNVFEAECLLNSAGFSFNRGNPFDLIIIYHIENKFYDIISINGVLNDLLGIIL
ncbi:MAG: hypothetical protein J1F31_03935 [Erysipelotrichales bacterium]|nr:hypothetical protein [Erysipelotrichales bacterium]